VTFPADAKPRARAGGIVVAAAVLLGLPTASGAGEHRAHPGFSLGGTTGLVNTPTADVLPDRALRFGFVLVDREWAYAGRGVTDNEIWFLSMGFLPRLEVSVRATVLPEIPLLEGREAPAVDRVASARFSLLDEGRWWPALAVGVDDVRGTRLFHSLYLVGTRSHRVTRGLELGLSAGFGSTALTARRHVLDGPFGGLEVRLGDRVSVVLDADTEKVNSGFRLTLFDRVSLHLALLHLDTVSGGVGWTGSL